MYSDSHSDICKFFVKKKFQEKIPKKNDFAKIIFFRMNKYFTIKNLRKRNFLLKFFFGNKRFCQKIVDKKILPKFLFAKKITKKLQKFCLKNIFSEKNLN